MNGMEVRLIKPKKRKVPNPPQLSSIGGVHITTATTGGRLFGSQKKEGVAPHSPHPQLLIVEIAFAFV
jgi:hypothetical protein